MIDEIQKRYTEEAGHACCLSCGSNIDALGIMPGEYILDLGCGTGSETFEAAKRVGSAGTACGLDITDAMLAKASEHARSEGISNTEFVKGNIEALPFEDKSFDAVMSNCVINHAKDKIKVYQEIFRVLKDGGRFVISDAVTKEPLPDSVKNDPEAWAQCWGGALTEKEYLDSIHDAGFSQISILKRREYLKNNYDFISLTIFAEKNIQETKGGA